MTDHRLKLTTAANLSSRTRPPQTYLGRVTKAHIHAAVREAVGDEAAERIAGLKKAEMAQAAERLLAGAGWLPSVLRTARPASRDAVSEAEPFAQAAE
ncbi:hypothetical protein [Aestuariivirga sp.]|uniref:hypothetical protein n=1 Tax=Aestuariivirga sp. TaxID=2650926 RepID=UPI003BA902B4